MCRSSARSATSRFSLAFSSRSCHNSRLVQTYPYILPFPGVRRLLANPQLPTDFGYLLPALGLMQRLQDLLFRITLPRHLRVLLVGLEGHASARLLNLSLAQFFGFGSQTWRTPKPFTARCLPS